MLIPSLLELPVCPPRTLPRVPLPATNLLRPECEREDLERLLKTSRLTLTQLVYTWESSSASLGALAVGQPVYDELFILPSFGAENH